MDLQERIRETKKKIAHSSLKDIDEISAPIREANYEKSKREEEMLKQSKISNRLSGVAIFISVLALIISVISLVCVK